MNRNEIIEMFENQFKSETLFKLMNVQLVEMKDDYAILTVDCNDDTVSFMGSLYGGVITFAADVAMYAALISKGMEKVVTTDLNVHYLDRFEKNIARFEAQVLRRGKKMIMAEVNVYNSDNVLAAHCTGSFLKT